MGVDWLGGFESESLKRLHWNCRLCLESSQGSTRTWGVTLKLINVSVAAWLLGRGFSKTFPKDVSQNGNSQRKERERSAIPHNLICLRNGMPSLLPYALVINPWRNLHKGMSSKRKEWLGTILDYYHQTA